MLYNPDRHYAFEAEAWSAKRASAFIQSIVDKTCAAYSEKTFWPPHELDRSSETEVDAFSTMYVGVEGVAWGLSYLASKIKMPLNLDVVRIYDACLARPTEPSDSYFFGESGLRLALQMARPSTDNRAALERSLDRLALAQTGEMMAGAQGAIIAWQMLWECERNHEVAAKIRALIDKTLESWTIDEASGLRVWQQQFGKHAVYVGAAHGAVGNIFSLLRASDHLLAGEHQEIQSRAMEFLKKSAVQDATGANWPAILPNGDRDYLLHWCHGAPGVLMQLALHLPRGIDREFDELLLKAGELVWRAGGLKKGGSLCHGTAGSGAAMLKLFERTGDELWLRRARAFAMAAFRQIENDEVKYGQLRYSLWTGDIGAAIFAEACINERFDVPMLDLI